MNDLAGRFYIIYIVYWDICNKYADLTQHFALKT